MGASFDADAVPTAFCFLYRVEYRCTIIALSYDRRSLLKFLKHEKSTSNVCSKDLSSINYIVIMFKDTLIRSKEALESDKWTM